MILDTCSSTGPRRFLRGLAIAAAAILPFGVAVAQNLEAVSKRLIEAVHAGELSSEDAAAMIGQLAQRRFLERLRHAHHEHHEQGGQRRPDAHHKARELEELAGHFSKLGFERVAFERVAESLRNIGVEDERLPPVLGRLGKALFLAREGKDADWLKGSLKEMGLEKDQVKSILELSKKLVAHSAKSDKPKSDKAKSDLAKSDKAKVERDSKDQDKLVKGYEKLGFSKDDLASIKGALSKAGVPEDSLGAALQALSQFLAKAQGGQVELGWLSEVLTAKLRLSDQPRALVLDIAKRLLAHLERKASLEKDLARLAKVYDDLGVNAKSFAVIKERLSAAEIQDDRSNSVLEVIAKALGGLRKGENPEWLGDFLANLELNDAQVAIVKGIIKRLHDQRPR